jgi:single-strand selective monofunctional uracil DNA glycosylase
MSDIADRLIAAARKLARAAGRLRFAAPVTHVYNPLDYAWAVHEAYARCFGGTRKQVLFLGMNPGPHGMMQTGVPFGEITAVRDWMGIRADVRRPKHCHPKLPVNGFAHTRSEVSGRRLWGLFAKRFGAARNFFAEHYVANYCPLGFLSTTGANLTPDKLRAAESGKLFTACDEHLCEVVAALRPAWVVGVGSFAADRAGEVLAESGARFGRILHPSPANPAAHVDWGGTVTRQLRELGVW